MPKKVKTRSHIVIPDLQTKAGVPLEHLSWIGQYIAHRAPDVVVCLGDFWDMPSLSSYDSGKKSFEGRRYKTDIEVGLKAMDMLLKPIRAKKKAMPRMVFLVGNHEERIKRAIESDAKLDGTIGYQDLKLKEQGWEVHDFLEVVEIDGIAYSHFFPRGANGSVTQSKNGAPTAKDQLRREGRSCIAGHRQGLEVCTIPFRGKMQWGIIAGSAYQHNEDYLSPQGNTHWRGIIVLHQVDDGQMDPMFVSIDYLKLRYGSPNKKA